MATLKSAFKYIHYVDPVPLNPDYPDKFNFVLISSIEQLKSILAENQNQQYVAFDTETSSLNVEQGFIVGFSFSFGKRTGYYVPVRHCYEDKSLGKEALDIFYEFLITRIKVFFFNYRFDIRFLQWAGYDPLKVPHYDVAQIVFLADTNVKYPSLKGSTLHFLGYRMTNFEEVTGGSYNFFQTNPEESYKYAAGDAICTFELAQVTLKFYNECKYVSDIDNYALLPIMSIENAGTFIDIPRLKGYDTELNSKLEELENQVYADLGKVFTITSPKQLSDALKSIGIYTGIDTDSGYMKTGIDELMPLIKSKKYPFLQSLVDYKENFKLYTSYVLPLKEEAIKKNGILRFSYKTTVVPTGRMAAGKDSRNPFFSSLPQQAISKSAAQDNYCLKIYDDNSLDHSDVNSPVIFGWKFAPEDKDSKTKISNLKLESQNQKYNVRSCFRCADDEYWLSIDFKAQELRIASVLCLAKTTVLITNLGEITLGQIEKLLSNQIVVSIKTPDGFKQIKNYYDSGLKKKCVLKLKNGQIIECSQEHRFLISRNNNILFCKLKNLNKESDCLIEESDNISKEIIMSALKDSGLYE